MKDITEAEFLELVRDSMTAEQVRATYRIGLDYKNRRIEALRSEIEWLRAWLPEATWKQYIGSRCDEATS